MTEMDRPCGRCECGIYAELAMCSPQAKYIVRTPADKRVTIACKTDRTKLCANAGDFIRYVSTDRGLAEMIEVQRQMGVAQ